MACVDVYGMFWMRILVAWGWACYNFISLFCFTCLEKDRESCSICLVDWLCVACCGRLVCYRMISHVLLVKGRLVDASC